MTRDEFLTKWAEQAEQMQRRQAWVNGADLCAEVLDDFHRVQTAEQEAVLTLKEAAQVSGFSPAHLGRLVRQGKLRSLRPLGSRGRLTFRRADLPQKPGGSNTAKAGVHDLASRLLGGRGARNGRS